MEEFDSIEEVLDFAIDRETESNLFYADLAKHTDNAAMRKVFENFAMEELGHKAKLEAMKAGKLAVSPREISNLKLADYVVDVEPKPDMGYQNALIMAMEKEKAAFHLYIDLAAAVEDNGQKATFLLLAQEEAGHKLRFEIEYDDMILKEN